MENIEYQKLIEFIIKKRKEVYYLVTETDLNDLKNKNTYSEIAYILASILLGGFISILITLNFNIELPNEVVSSFQIWLFIFGLLGVIFLALAIYFGISKHNAINNLKGKEEISFEPDTYKNYLNPNLFIGNKKLIMNIPTNERDKFYTLMKEKKELNLLDTSEKQNTIKKEHFTFEINNANDLLYQHFEEYLRINNINFIDYRFKVK